MQIEDIKRINYIYYSSFRQLVKKPHCLFVCYCLFFIRLIQSLFYIKKAKKPEKEVLFFAPTLNNEKSIKTIINCVEGPEYVVWNHMKWCLPWAKIFISSIGFFPLFQKFYWQSSPEDKLLIRQFYKAFMSTCGCYHVFDKMLKNNYQLKLIVFANDHSFENRCLLEVAEKHDIKTLYVQHASVTERFPPLNFTYSFLDGMDSYKKYIGIGNVRGDVFITGSPRFDEVCQYKGKEKDYEIGIALNSLDDIKKIKEVCRYLKDNRVTKISVRPHPAMKDSDYSEFEEFGCAVSHSNTESSLAFLSKIKLLIANESSIHLDAAIMDVPSVLYNFSNHEIIDWYSYAKNGLVKVCETKDGLLSAIKTMNKPEKEKVQFYSASYGTPYEGRVGELVASLIPNILCGKKEDNVFDRIFCRDNAFGCYLLKQ